MTHEDCGDADCPICEAARDAAFETYSPAIFERRLRAVEDEANYRRQIVRSARLARFLAGQGGPCRCAGGVETPELREAWFERTRA